jgi:hypothetical protein
MTTHYESATLILNLYDLRREESMRKARDYFFGFNPATADEFMAEMFGPNSGMIRQVISYWDMAGVLVLNGAIDPKMFYEANGEFISVFAKIEPILPGIRKAFDNPTFAANLEKLALGMPDARARLDSMAERMKMFAAKRAAATQPQS